MALLIDDRGPGESNRIYDIGQTLANSFFPVVLDKSIESDGSRDHIYCIVQKHEQINNPQQYEVPLAEKYSIAAILQENDLFPMVENRHQDDESSQGTNESSEDFYSDDGN